MICLQGVSEAWADALLKFQFNSGLEAFLDYFPGTRAIDDGMDERLVRGSPVDSIRDVSACRQQCTVYPLIAGFVLAVFVRQLRVT